MHDLLGSIPGLGDDSGFCVNLHLYDWEDVMVDNTIDSEVDELVRSIYSDGFDNQAYLENRPQPKFKPTMPEAKTAITNLIAQEANKARLDELKRLPDTKPPWFDPKIHISYIDERIKALTADKEQA